MKDQTSNLVIALYSKKLGVKITKVTSTSGEPPGEANNFLFNPIFDQFQGFAYGENGAKYIFFLIEDKNNWTLESTKIGVS